jgi:hypothetical protein
MIHRILQGTALSFDRAIAEDVDAFAAIDTFDNAFADTKKFAYPCDILDVLHVDLAMGQLRFAIGDGENEPVLAFPIENDQQQDCDTNTNTNQQRGHEAIVMRIV